MMAPILFEEGGIVRGFRQSRAEVNGFDRNRAETACVAATPGSQGHPPVAACTAGLGCIVRLRQAWESGSYCQGMQIAPSGADSLRPAFLDPRRRPATANLKQADARRA